MEFPLAHKMPLRETLFSLAAPDLDISLCDHYFAVQSQSVKIVALAEKNHTLISDSEKGVCASLTDSVSSDLS